MLYDVKKISWLSPKIEVRNIGAITGSGTFAKETIEKGETIIVQGGRILHSSELDDLQNQGFSYHGFQVEKDFYIYPITPDVNSLDGIFNVNHSCEPNCGFSGPIKLVSIEKINIGDEITYDYAMTDMNPGEKWEDMQCLCNSSKCRKIITGEDWKLPNLQKKYSKYFSPYIQDLIRNMK